MPNQRPQGPTSRAGDPSIEVPREATEYTPERYAVEARESYDRDPEKPKSFLEKVSQFMKNGVRSVMREFQEGGFLKKSAIVAGVGGLALLGVNVIRKAASALGNAFGSIFGIGEWVKEKLSDTKTSTIGSILKWTLLPLLGITTVSTIYEAVKGKLSLTETLEAWRRGGLKGVGALLLQKEREGIVNMGRDAANALSERLGLPSIDSVREQVNRVREEVSESFEWLNEKLKFDELLGTMRAELESRGITVPDFLKNLNIATVARELGITQENETSWSQYVVMGGTAYLLYQWIGKKGLIINAALYLLFIRYGKESIGSKLITQATEKIDEAKNHLMEKTKEIPGAEFFIADAFDDFSFQENIDELLEWAKDHPAEAMLTINATWILRAFIGKAFIKLFKTGGHMAIYSFRHPVRAAAGYATLYGFYKARRGFTDTFIDAVYENAATNPEAQEMRTTLYKVLDIDPEKPESLADKQIPEFTKSLLEDPIKALRMDNIIETFRRGDMAVAIDIRGRFILIAKGLSAPIQLTKLTVESFKTAAAAMIEDDNNILVPMTVAGAEMLVFGSMAFSGFQAYRTVIGSGEGLGKCGRAILSLIPGTKEWQFVFRSSVLHGWPGARMVYENMQARKIGVSFGDIDAIRSELRQTNPDKNRITKLMGNVKERLNLRDFDEIKDALKGNRLSYLFAEKMKNIHVFCEDAVKETSKLRSSRFDQSKVKLDIEHSLEEIETKLREFDTLLANLIRRGTLILRGEFREAMRFKIEGEDSITGRPIASLETNFKGKTADQLRTQKETLEKELWALSPTDPNRALKIKELAAIETYLDPESVASAKEITNELKGLSDTDRAAKLEEWAARIEGFDKGMHEKFAEEMDEIVEEAKRLGLSLSDPKITAKLLKLDDNLILPFRAKKETWLKTLQEEYAKLPRKLRTTRLKSQMRLAVQGAEGSFLTKISKGVKGRMKLAAVLASAMFVTETALESREKDTTEAIIENLQQLAGPEGWQLLIDVLPISGTLSACYSVATGKAYMTGQETSRLQNVFWGIAGAAGDTFTVLSLLPSGGTSIGGNIILRLTRLAAKGSGPAQKLINGWPTIEKAVEASGGWYEFCKKVLNYIRKDKGKIAHGLRVAEGASVLTGTTLMVGGVAANLFYGVPDSEIPEFELD